MLISLLRCAVCRKPEVLPVDVGFEVTVAREAYPSQVPLPAYELFASRDLLHQMAVERLLAGLSTRPLCGRPGAGGQRGRSRCHRHQAERHQPALVAMTRTGLEEFMTRRLDEVRPWC